MPEKCQHRPGIDPCDYACAVEYYEREHQRELIQAVREFVQDRYLDPANPMPFEIALSDAIDQVEKTFNA